VSKADHTRGGFRGLNWGSTIIDAIKLWPKSAPARWNKESRDDDALVVDEDTVAGLPACLKLHFKDGKLDLAIAYPTGHFDHVSGLVRTNFDDNSKYSDAFEKLDSLLVKKYGAPVERKIDSSLSNVGAAPSYTVIWTADDTSITLDAIGMGRMIIVKYESRAEERDLKDL
jgi:hypothetical protein